MIRSSPDLVFSTSISSPRRPPAQTAGLSAIVKDAALAASPLHLLTRDLVEFFTAGLTGSERLTRSRNTEFATRTRLAELKTKWPTWPGTSSPAR